MPSITEILMALRGLTPGIPGVPGPPRPMDEVPRPNVQGPYAPEVQQPTFTSQGSALGIPEEFKPAHTAQDQYQFELMNQPTRKSPGKGRRFAGILAGIGAGPSAAENIMYSPYRREMEDWGIRTEGLAKMAGFENQDNVQGRLAHDANTRNRIAAERENRLAQATRYKQEHPNQELRPVEINGRIMWAWFDPTNTSIPPVNTGWTKDEFTQAEAINFTNQGRVAAAEAGRATDPAAQQRQQYLRAMQLVNSDAKLASIISLGDPGSGSFTMDPPETAFSKWAQSTLPGPLGRAFNRSEAQANYKKALDFIYGTGPNPSENSSLPAPPAARPGTGAIPIPQAAPNINQAPAPIQAQPPMPQGDITVPNPRLRPAPMPSSQPQAQPNFKATSAPMRSPAAAPPKPPAGGNAYKPPTNQPAPQPITRGAKAPPREQVIVGQIHVWPDGTAGKWNGSDWIKVGK